MGEQDQEKNSDMDVQPAVEQSGRQFDAASRSLAEALRISFVILKIIMIVLVVVFLASGFRTVGPDEEALVLRFGRIKPVGEERVLGPGLHWAFPYPIDEIVKVPVEKKVNLAINSFWYFQSEQEILQEESGRPVRVPQKLSPITDGYCITRSEERGASTGGSADSDYNIVHCKWQLVYQIKDAERFFKNIYVQDVTPGESYFDAITESITPLLENVIEDAVVSTMVNYTIDEAVSSHAGISAEVKRSLQKNLDQIDSGIKVISIQLTESRWPRQVNKAFEDFIRASQERQKIIGEARTYAEETLNAAAGPVAEELLAILKGKKVSKEKEDLLWNNLAGAAQEEIAQARADRTKVVESARANADYLLEILPEYRKRPELVVQRIYLDALESVLTKADEKFVIPPAQGAKDREIRVLVNRDPTIKRESKE